MFPFSSLLVENRGFCRYDTIRYDTIRYPFFIEGIHKGIDARFECCVTCVYFLNDSEQGEMLIGGFSGCFGRYQISFIFTIQSYLQFYLSLLFKGSLLWAEFMQLLVFVWKV